MSRATMSMWSLVIRGSYGEGASYAPSRNGGDACNSKNFVRESSEQHSTRLPPDPIEPLSR